MDENVDSNEAEQGGDADQPVTPWMHATLDDIVGLDFEAPITGMATADCNELSVRFLAAAQSSDGSTDPADTPRTRVFTMLAAVTGMHFKPQERNEPFGPMLVLADGHRSAIASDFRPCVELLAAMAESASNLVLRARLSDLCWLLDRKRGKIALAAIAAYTTIVQKVGGGELSHRFAIDDGALHHESRGYVQRALQIGRSVGWDKPQTVEARELTVKLRQEAVAKRVLVPIHSFCELDLIFSVSDPAEIGGMLDEVLADLPADAPLHIVVDLWRLAAQAYHLAKKEEDKNRCLTEAAERLVAEAQSKQASAMLASHFLSSAIAALHGIPGKKDRRTALRHQLVDLQARVPDEMSVFSQELDLKEIVETVEETVGRVGLFDKLFIFAGLATSPNPMKLASDAVESIEMHPLSSLFGTSHLDREGKVIYRSQGGGFGDRADDSAIRHKVAQAESVRRKLVVSGKIEPARHTILGQHFISDDVFVALLQCSPFIPSDLTATFARGFTRFFQGDFVSATYILTPLLENSLRHVLKSNGHDVTIFDDATQTQEDRTISSLFEQMRAELDSVITPAIAADIERVFLSKPGPCLRHALSHGLFHDSDPYGADAIYGCWLIFRLCLLPLVRHREKLRSILGGGVSFLDE